MDSFFKDNPYFISQHHLDSFDLFVKEIIPDLVRTLNPFVMIKTGENNEVVYKTSVFIGGLDGKSLHVTAPKLDGQPLFPNEARLRNMSYAMELYADIEVHTENPKLNVEKLKSVRIGSIPLMLHSEHCYLRDMRAEMLRTLGECQYDPGGYFIVDGKEKVIIAQERKAMNRLFISKPNPKNLDNVMYRGYIQCTAESGEARMYPKSLQMKLLFPKGQARQAEDPEQDETTKAKTKNEDADDKGKESKNNFGTEYGPIRVSLPKIAVDIPLFIMFRALGLESDRAIMTAILGRELNEQQFLDVMRPSILDAAQAGIWDQEAALKWLTGGVRFKSKAEVQTTLVNELLPNLKTQFKKVQFLAHMTRELISVPLDIKQATDRDSFTYKRVDLSGFLMANQFRDAYNAFRNNVRNELDRIYLYGASRMLGAQAVACLIKKDNQSKVFNPRIIDEQMTRFMKGRGQVEGVVQDLSRLSYQSFISHLRRVDNPMDRSIKIAAPHRLHSQQYGIMCPFESPDGKAVGFLKNLAMSAMVTFGQSPEELKELQAAVKSVCGKVSEVSEGEGLNAGIQGIQLHINGDWLGNVPEKDGFQIVKQLRAMRRQGELNPFISISWDIVNREIRLQGEAGRCARPLLLTPLRPDAEYRQPWQTLLKTGLIEYLDTEEANTALIAMWPSHVTRRTTHVELHPALAFSVVSNNTPYLNHNQAPRNIFSGSQGKQAIGLYATNFLNRIDTVAYCLSYPQRPLILTRFAPHIHSDVMPTGENLIVAIATYTGFNQEDSVILNRRSLQRGMFRTNIYKAVVEKEERLDSFSKFAQTQEEDGSLFINPLKVLASGKLQQLKRDVDYSHLDEQGIVKLGTVIDSRHKIALIGKCMIHTVVQLKDEAKGATDFGDSIFEERIREETYSDATVVSDKSHYGTVDKVFVGLNASGQRVCKIRLRQTRSPELGDKMSSKHGQKGTVGMILNQEDMPFTKSGICPDIIVNPHAFPSRMTIGHLIECVVAKVGVLDGCISDGTAFIDIDIEGVAATLETKYQFERYGNELLYNGKTGDQMATDIYIGPTYYQRLKHMVEDKVQSRSTGPRVQRTHQPTPGRGHDGGLKIGEMERDAILSHGAAQFMKESMMERSDKFSIQICESCGEIPITNSSKTSQIFRCQNCSNELKFVESEVPYAFKLFLQELECMNIVPRLLTKKAD